MERVMAKERRGKRGGDGGVQLASEGDRGEGAREPGSEGARKRE